MESGNNDVVTALNELISTCRDGQYGYRSAADHVDDPEIQALFDSYALQRTQFINDLQAAVRYYGGTFEPAGSPAGAIHRGWLALAASTRDEADVLAQCERGEHKAVKTYEAALQKSLPADVLPLMEYQYWQVRAAYERIRAIEAGRRV